MNKLLLNAWNNMYPISRGTNANQGLSENVSWQGFKLYGAWNFWKELKLPKAKCIYQTASGWVSTADLIHEK